MSQPSRPRANGPEHRRSHKIRLEAILALEERQLLAPFVSVGPTTAVFLPNAAQTPGTTLGGETLAYGSGVALASQTGASVALPSFPEAAAITSVSELTPTTSFGGDIVRIRTGPGGDFGNALYAISRGAGDNLATGAINRPGVIYRVDPATGKSSVFFDLNTVIPQLDPTQTSAANSAGPQTGLVNWYDMTFDREGIFDGRPSLFVSSVDSANPAKNAIYRIAPDGTFLGAFTTFSDNSLNAAKLTFNPSAILIPPVEQQTFLRGLISGTGTGSVTGVLGNATGGGFGSTSTQQFAALFFDATAFRPGTPINSTGLKTGVKQTFLTFGPQTGLASANNTYNSLVYSTFADFGTPQFGTIFTPQAGFSGIQGLTGGELLINQGQDPNALAATAANPTTNIDLYPAASTNFRRYEDIAFDQYGYFSQGLPITGGTTAAGNGTGAGAGAGGTFTGTLGAPVYAGSVFAADLSTGLAVSVTIPAVAPPATLPTGTTAPTVPILLPVQGPGLVGITQVSPTTGAPTQVTFPGGPGNIQPVISGSPFAGGRIVRIDQFGRVSNFAQGFATSNDAGSASFAGSSLSITFSADGTTLYAADDQGVWQFKTTASLAGSSSGSIVGLNDLRTLGVPYDGSNSAVAVVDTGVDARNTSFRGRVAPGIATTITNGLGNDDFAAGLSGIGSSGSSTNGGTGGGGGAGGTTGTGGGGGTTGGGTNGGTTGTGTTGGGTTGTTTAIGQSITLNQNGHGTPVAGIIAQFVPQATIDPINVFQPFTAANANGIGAVAFSSNQATTTDAVFSGLQYVANNPYVQDPVRPQNNDRVITASLAFGTSQTFETEQTAFKQYPQVVISFKNELDKLLKVGIAPIAAAGQFGSPVGAITGTVNPAIGATNNAANTLVGDVNGMSLPAVLNEVISVTGTYPFIFQDAANTPPTDPAQTLLGRIRGPVLVFGNTVNTPGSLGDSGPAGGTAGSTTGGGTGGGAGGAGGTGGGTTGGGTGAGTNTGTNGAGNSLGQLTAADGGGGGGTGAGSGGGTGGGAGGAGGAGGGAGNTANGSSLITFSDRILGSANRSTTTDFAAPALDAPTFRRVIGNVQGFDPNTFQEGGTSVSSAIVTGSYSLVSSALDYWTQLRAQGTTSSAYLNTPVGSHVLNFAPNKLYNLAAYNTPNGINSILAYTAVPAADINDNLTVAGPPKLLGSTLPRSFARVDVGNAIAAIEGKVALDYLIKHNTFNIIDTNHNGLITSQEIQNFVDRSNAIGLPEAGAMARLLGGTARSAVTNAFTGVGLNGIAEQPDQPDVLQRRFNFFDYAAHGKLQGSISIAQLKLLSKYILPTPDSYTITDRQRASANGFLIAPASQRNFKNLQHLKPAYSFVPKAITKRYPGVSPAQFGVNYNLKGDTTNGPVYTLFDGKAGAASTASTVGNVPNLPLTATTTLGTVNGSNFAPSTTSTTSTSTASPTSSATPTTTSTPATTPAAAQTPAPTTTPAQAAATTPATAAPTPTSAPAQAQVGTPVTTNPTAPATQAGSASSQVATATNIPSNAAFASTATTSTTAGQTATGADNSVNVAQQIAALLPAQPAGTSTVNNPVAAGQSTPKASTSATN